VVLVFSHGGKGAGVSQSWRVKFFFDHRVRLLDFRL
jgi:hypothetical protein